MKTEWLQREALITVKTYPNPSTKYRETVCVAAITREEGWVRLYPIVQFRSLPQDQQFSKYQLVNLRMKRHPKDSRAESYRPDPDSIKLGDIVSSKDDWRQRWHWIRDRIGPSMCEIQKQPARIRQSLACIKPVRVDDFTVEAVSAEFSGKQQDAIDQLSLFDRDTNKLEKIPYRFKYHYRCEYPTCAGHHQSFIDWEVMQFYRRHRDVFDTPNELCDAIRNKFFGELCGETKDTHFFVGNMQAHLNTFLVLGVFWPPKSAQSEMF